MPSEALGQRYRSQETAFIRKVAAGVEDFGPSRNRERIQKTSPPVTNGFKSLRAHGRAGFSSHDLMGYDPF